MPELFASSRTAIPCARPDACGVMQMHACGMLARPVTHGRDERETLTIIFVSQKKAARSSLRPSKAATVQAKAESGRIMQYVGVTFCVEYCALSSVYQQLRELS